jgi:lysyl-tRNA synthetase class 2
MQLSEQEIIRRQSMDELNKLGINPYPAELFDVNVTSQQIHTNYPQQEFKDVSIAGRIMTRRVMGNASFAELQDETGRIQVYFRRDDICPSEDKTLYNIVFKKLLDIGDIIGVTGFVFTTQTGEVSIHVTSFKVLSKSLRPLPIVKETKDEQGNSVLHGESACARCLCETHTTGELYAQLPDGKRIFGSGNPDTSTIVWRCCCKAF